MVDRARCSSRRGRDAHLLSERFVDDRVLLALQPGEERLVLALIDGSAAVGPRHGVHEGVARGVELAADAGHAVGGVGLDDLELEHGFVAVGSNYGAAERGTIYRYDARRTLADPQAGAVECSRSGTSWFRVIVLGPNEWVTTTTPKDTDSHRILGARMAWWVER